ncbi:agrin-like isoform x4 [Dermatophagoides farinae]|uniref:Agrin-like isoform x4 n=1 Tax=Dermatophagoides farinae TaxID=6954 RepID=A0A9D4SI19_DERFA|nr:agrin-like isoform X1 [Dermatophagoides farinae]KAH7642712.1 agrin-like isoform x4 [Dermatophagoides farinae]
MFLTTINRTNDSSYLVQSYGVAGGGNDRIEDCSPYPHQQQQYKSSTAGLCHLPTTTTATTTVELANVNHQNQHKLITSKMTYYALMVILITGIMMLVVVPLGSTFLFIDYKQQLAQRKSNKSDFCKSKCQYGAECILDEYTNQAYCRCPLSCPDDYQPVCGSDGTTYINQCHLKYESCNKQQNIRIASNGTCDAALCKNVVCQRYQRCQVDENGHTKCVCSSQSSDVCSMNNNHQQQPVCGSNGKLYDSLCELEKYSCFYNIDVVPVDKNFCTKTTITATTKTNKQKTKWSDYSNNNDDDDDDAIYSTIDRKDGGIVCGDQVCHHYAKCQYINRQQQSTNTSLSSLRTTTTTTTTIATMKTCQCQNNCSNEYDPVCGSNHQNYANECEMRSYACSRQIDITVLHHGVCGQCYPECQYYSKCQLNEKNIPECICPQVCIRVDQPVCGDNGVTYENECELRVASCRIRKQIKIQFNSSCDLCHNVICHYGATCVDGECLCTDNCQNNLVEPLCANDGNTYRNECEMNRMACNSRKELIALFYGQCEETNENYLEEFSSLIQDRIQIESEHLSSSLILDNTNIDCNMNEMNRTCRLHDDMDSNYIHICDNRIFQSKCDMLQYGCHGSKQQINCTKHYCHCHKNGIERSITQLCNEKNGQCSCRKGFQGIKCDSCATDYWNAAGTTINSKDMDCKPCNCNPIGSINQQCNDFKGKCVHDDSIKNNINNNGTFSCLRNRCRFGAICQSNGSCTCNFNCKSIHHNNNNNHRHQQQQQQSICASDGSIHKSMCHFRQYMCNLQKRLQIIKNCRVH